MKKEFVVCVAASSVTWTHLKKFCFNRNFLKNRSGFDLAVVLNGENIEAQIFINGFQPDYLLTRPNTGIDSAAFDFLLKRIPEYKHYVLLHDDHWFRDDRWLDTLRGLVSSDDAAYQIWGNIYDIPQKILDDTQKIHHIAEILGYQDLNINDHKHFVQGYAGLYSGLAIKKILELDGIPHIHGNNRKTTQVLERLFSFMLMDMGFELKQIPPGFEQYLMHNTWAEENHLRRLAEKYFSKGAFEKAIEILDQVVNTYHTTKYDHLNLGTIHLKLNQLNQSVRHFRQALEMDPRLDYARKILSDLEVMHKI